MTLLKRMCLCSLRLKNIIFYILYIIVAPLCPAFLKRVDFYKAHRSEKRGLRRLSSYPVRCDWPNTSSVSRKCSQWNTASPLHGAGGCNNTARIIVPPYFFAYTFGRCYANLPTPWRRHVKIKTKLKLKLTKLKTWGKKMYICYFVPLYIA